MNKKNSAIAIVVVVVAIIAVGVIGFNGRAKAPEILSVAGSTSTAISGTSVSSTLISASSTNASSGISVVFSTSTQKSYTGASFSFSYPGNWAIASPSPLLMTNFSGQYEANGVIPADGVQLIVVTTTISGNLDSIMASELVNADDLITSTATVDGVACAKATYQVNYAPPAVAQNVSVYCPRGNTLWKIYLSYPANDPSESTDISEFNAMLGSMKLLG